MTETRIVPLASSRIAVLTPYHPAIVKEAKRLMGEWKQVTLGDGTREMAWVLLAEHKDAIEAKIAELWPPPSELQEVVVSFHCPRQTPCIPRIDGLDVLYLARDEVRIKHHPNVVEILTNALRPGGSKRSPTVGGDLQVRARVRPGAQATWADYEATVAMTPVEQKEMVAE